MKIGILNSGIYWQEFGFRKSGYSFDILYIYKIDWKINDYDIIIIPKGIHQGFLNKYSNKIYQWINLGGIIVSFGEVDGNWIKETSWEPSIKGQTIKLVDNEHPILYDIKEDDINLWSKAVHGFFKKIPENSKLLIEDDKKNPIAFIDVALGRGKLLAMTLDPDYHAYTEIEFAKTMLNNIIDWAHQEAKKNHKHSGGIDKRSSFVSKLFYYFTDIVLSKTNIVIILTGIITGIVVAFLINYFK